MRHTKSQRNQRRSHDALQTLPTTACPKCGTLVLRHQACSNCGFYRGRQVINVAALEVKKEKKRKEKAQVAGGATKKEE